MDVRYTLDEMAAVWSYESKYTLWVKSCLAVLFALASLDRIGKNIYTTIRRAAGFDLETVEKLDKKYKQDAQALIEACKLHMRSLGIPEDVIVHFGNMITSYDMEDPAFARLICLATDIIIKSLERMIKTLRRRAMEFEYTLCLFETHGQGAGPGYLGIRLCNWIDILERDLQRIRRARRNMQIGRFAGIIGVYGELDPEVEKIACKYLKLKSARISTQILHRDRHADLMNALALCATNVDHIATTLWAMCGYPKCEAREAFDWINQRGSTGMPHKRNPWRLERLSGMASAMRGYQLMVMEQVKTPFERAISQSSVERIAWVDGTTLLHFMLEELDSIFSRMEFFPENMQQNLDGFNGVLASQHIKDLLRKKGIFKLRFSPTGYLRSELIRCGKMDEADYALEVETYDWVKYCVYEAWDMKTNRSIDHLRNVVVRQGIEVFLTHEELDECFDLKRGLAHADEIYARFHLITSGVA